MLGVAMLFIQSSTKQIAEQENLTSLLPSEGSVVEEETSNAREGLLLGGRLLLAGLFCFVGVVEGQRVLWGDLHDPPDGHDLLWPKLVQLLFLVPFTLGFKTKAVTLCIPIIFETKNEEDL